MKAFKEMQAGKVHGEDQIKEALWKDRRQIILQKQASLYTQCLMTATMPESWKNANVLLIHEKGDRKDFKTYRPISLLSVAYNIFTNVIANRTGATLDFSPTVVDVNYAR